LRTSLKRSKTLKTIVAVAAAGTVFFAGAGAAQALSTYSAGVSERAYFATEANAWQLPTASSGAWVNIPGITRTVSIASGTTRQIVATYSAESLCQGSGWCSVRIIAVNTSTGATTELSPVAGTDYAFDSDGDLWEGHAMNRTVRFGAGTYRVLAQAARVAGSSTTSPTFRLDEQFFEVELRN
jgi:hypothetical protein